MLKFRCRVNWDWNYFHRIRSRRQNPATCDFHVPHQLDTVKSRSMETREAQIPLVLEPSPITLLLFMLAYRAQILVNSLYTFESTMQVSVGDDCSVRWPGVGVSKAEALLVAPFLQLQVPGNGIVLSSALLNGSALNCPNVIIQAAM